MQAVLETVIRGSQRDLLVHWYEARGSQRRNVRQGNVLAAARLGLPVHFVGRSDGREELIRRGRVEDAVNLRPLRTPPNRSIQP